MRHGRAVVVRRGVLELVDVDGEDLALAVEHDVGKDLVDAVNGRTRVVGDGTHAHGVGESEALIGLGGDLRGLGRLGSGLRLGLGAGAGYGVLDGVDDAVAGVGRAGDDVHVRRVRRDDGRRYLLERRARYLGRLAVRHDLDRGDLVAVHGDGDSDGAHEAVGSAGEHTCSAGLLHELARGVHAGDDGGGADGRAGDGVDVAVHGEVALGVHEANEAVEVVLHSEAKAVGVVDVADGVALDHAVIVDGDEKLDLVHIAVRSHG